jgi:hypothetical protein
MKALHVNFTDNHGTQSILRDLMKLDSDHPELKVFEFNADNGKPVAFIRVPSAANKSSFLKRASSRKWVEAVLSTTIPKTQVTENELEDDFLDEEEDNEEALGVASAATSSRATWNVTVTHEDVGRGLFRALLCH